MRYAPLTVTTTQRIEHPAAERGEAFDPATLGEGRYRLLEVQTTVRKIHAAGGGPAATE